MKQPASDHSLDIIVALVFFLSPLLSVWLLTLWPLGYDVRIMTWLSMLILSLISCTIGVIMLGVSFYQFHKRRERFAWLSILPKAIIATIIIALLVNILLASSSSVCHIDNCGRWN